MPDISRQDLLLNAELDEAQQRAVQRAVRAGSLHRIAPGIATPHPPQEWAAVIRRNKLRVLAAELPGAVVTFRSGFDGMVSEPITLAYSHARRLDLPGLSAVTFSGSPAQDDDLPAGGGRLYWASPARMLLDNLARDISGRNASLDQLEERLVQLCDTSGEERLRSLLLNAERVAPKIGREKELHVLRGKIGAVLGTRETELLASHKARLAAQLVDAERMELFDSLVAFLRTTPLPVTPDPIAIGGPNVLSHFAFLESYFSNFIEGTEFEIEEGADIALNNKQVADRPKDAHDIKGVFEQIVSPAWRNQVLLETPAVVAQLCDRHKAMMAARPEVRPGELKLVANQAGNTRFVAPHLVRGTLVKAAQRLPELPAGMARAIYAMFVVSEVHPFIDGNGRLARLVMNAQLSAAEQCRIIVPTLMRETYLDTLRVLTRERDPVPFVKAMVELQNWTFQLDFRQELGALIQSVRSTNGLERSLTHFRLHMPQSVSPQEDSEEVVQADAEQYQEQPGGIERDYQLDDMALNAAANPHYRAALAKLAPEVLEPQKNDQAQPLARQAGQGWSGRGRHGPGSGHPEGHAGQLDSDR